MLIDTHCHLTFDGLRERVGEVLARAIQAGVERVITVATTPTEARAALEIARAHPQVYVAAGIHPHEAGNVSQDDLAALGELHRSAAEPRLVAVGETGLDLHYRFAGPEVQERVFRFQLGLACEVGRPVVIHAREAEQRVCEILADYPALAGRAVFHCFSAGPDMARRVLDAGCWISFTGLATFRNAEPVREAARLVPADRIMVETDAPYLTPEPVRKQRPNEPALVVHTARRLAEVRGESFEQFAQTTTRNAERFFGLGRET